MSRRFFIGRIGKAIIALVAIHLAACTSIQPLPAPGPGWKTHTGQLLYRGPERSVIGEVVVRHNGPGGFALNFIAGPGFPLLNLQISGDNVVAEGALARGRWQGTTQKVPRNLAGWVALRDVFSRIPGKPEEGTWTAQLKLENGKVQHLDARFARTSERFAFHLGS